MEISKAVFTALKALSYPDINIKKNYKLARNLINITHYHYLKPFYGYYTWDHKIFLQDHEIPVRIFSPDDDPIVEQQNHPVLLFFHGGGWVTGNIDSYDKVCANLARMTNHLVVSVDYRLAPEYPFPAALNDCYEVAREIYGNKRLLNTGAERITLIGDSAGANLAIAVSLLARNRGEFLPQRQILIYPATYNDHGETSPFKSIRENGTDYLLTSKKICDYMDLYLGENKERYWLNPYFAPLLAKDLSNQPNTLLLTAEFDPLRDEGEAYGEKLKKAGNFVEMHRIQGALHGYFSLSPAFGQVKESYKYINGFLSEVPYD